MLVILIALRWVEKTGKDSINMLWLSFISLVFLRLCYLPSWTSRCSKRYSFEMVL